MRYENSEAPNHGEWIIGGPERRNLPGTANDKIPNHQSCARTIGLLLPKGGLLFPNPVKEGLPTTRSGRGLSVFGDVAKQLSVPNSTRMSAFLHRFRIEVSRDVKRPANRVAYRQDFLGCSVATLVSLVRDLTGSRFSPRPVADDRQCPAAAIEGVCLGRPIHRRNQVRSIAIRTEGNEIACETLRTFHAMANTQHKKCADGNP
jgi:hypothetical protein